jgi:beta-glucanase (GH16 family)
MAIAVLVVGVLVTIAYGHDAAARVRTSLTPSTRSASSTTGPRASTSTARPSASTGLNPAAADHVAGPPAGEWNAVFSDDFSGSALDASKWSSCYPWDCTNRSNNELEWYQASQATVGDGLLSLIAQPEQINGFPYASGMITTFGKFSYTYGYAQIVAKLPSGKGMWPAFWTLPVDETWPPEMDIMEKWGTDDVVHAVVHYGQTGDQWSTIDLPTYAESFHTYGMDWEPGSITWYVDGFPQAVFAVSIAQAQYLLANLAVSGSPAPDASVSFPQRLEVRSITVWQHPGVGSSSSSP